MSERGWDLSAVGGQSSDVRTLGSYARTSRQQSIHDALTFLHDAAVALDQAEACLRDVGLEREIPEPSLCIDWTAVFPHTSKQPSRVAHCLNVQELLESVMALRQEAAVEKAEAKNVVPEAPVP